MDEVIFTKMISSRSRVNNLIEVVSVFRSQEMHLMIIHPVSTRQSQHAVVTKVKEASHLAVRGHATSSDIAANQTDRNSLSNEQTYLLVVVLYNPVRDQAVANVRLGNGPST
jgi:hypothetical protein